MVRRQAKSIEEPYASSTKLFLAAGAEDFITSVSVTGESQLQLPAGPGAARLVYKAA